VPLLFFISVKKHGNYKKENISLDFVHHYFHFALWLNLGTRGVSQKSASLYREGRFKES
jgi:hypothetical protein